MVEAEEILIGVLACNYGNDGKTLGSHSMIRLDQPLADYAGAKACVTFVFSAGTLTSNPRLCDLQAEYVRAHGFKAVVPNLDASLIWGSKAELQFLRLQQVLHPAAHVEVASEDYQMARLKKLARKVGLVDPSFISASSASDPPSRRTLRHEWLGRIEALVPDWVMAFPKFLRRLGLRAGVIKY